MHCLTSGKITNCKCLKTKSAIKCYLFAAVSRLTLQPTQPPIQWVLRVLSLGIKWLQCEAAHSPPLPILLHGVMHNEAHGIHLQGPKYKVCSDSIITEFVKTKTLCLEGVENKFALK